MVHRAGFAGRMGPPSGGRRFTTILSPEMVSVPSYVTFTRASSGTHFNNTGTLVTDASDVARFDFNPLTLQPRGLLLEGARTNLILNSEDLSNASWVKVDSTITTDNITSPSGAVNADLVTEGSAGTAELAQTTTISSGVTHTQSIFLKRGNNDWFRVEASDNTSANGTRAWVNLATGALGNVAAFGTGTNPTASVQALSNDWYRIQVTGTVAAATTAKLRIASATANGSTTRVSGATYYAWGGQSEQSASFASSYIPTTGASATRAADASLISVLSSIGFNASEGTLLIEFQPMGYPPASQFPSVFEFQNGALTERILLTYRHTNGEIRGDSFVGGVTQGTFGSTLGVPLSVYKTAVAYSLNNFGISTNGGAVASDLTATVPAVDRLTLMQNSGGDRVFGWVRRIVYYSTRLPDAQLQALTV